MVFIFQSWGLIKSLEQSRSAGRSASTWVTLIPSQQNQPAQRSHDVPWFPLWPRAQQLLAPSGGPEVPGEVLPEPQDPASHQGESSCCWSHSEGNNLFVLLLLFIITVNSLILSNCFSKDTNIVWFLINYISWCLGRLVELNCTNCKETFFDFLRFTFFYINWLEIKRIQIKMLYFSFTPVFCFCFSASVQHNGGKREARCQDNRGGGAEDDVGGDIMWFLRLSENRDLRLGLCLLGVRSDRQFINNHLIHMDFTVSTSWSHQESLTAAISSLNVFIWMFCCLFLFVFKALLRSSHPRHTRDREL